MAGRLALRFGPYLVQSYPPLGQFQVTAIITPPFSPAGGSTLGGARQGQRGQGLGLSHSDRQRCQALGDLDTVCEYAGSEV